MGWLGFATTRATAIHIQFPFVGAIWVPPLKSIIVSNARPQVVLSSKQRWVYSSIHCRSPREKKEVKSERDHYFHLHWNEGMFLVVKTSIASRIVVVRAAFPRFPSETRICENNIYHFCVGNRFRHFAFRLYASTRAIGNRATVRPIDSFHDRF